MNVFVIAFCIRHNLDYWPMQLLERTTVALQEDFLPQKMATQMALSKARISDAIPEGPYVIVKWCCAEM